MLSIINPRSRSHRANLMKRSVLRTSLPHGLQPISKLIALRLLILIFALIATSAQALLSDQSSVFDLQTDFLLLALFFAVTSGSALWVRTHGVSSTFKHLQLFIDPLIVTAIVYRTGGPVSPFIFLYIPLVMFGVFFFSNRAGTAIIALSGAVYTILIVAMKYSLVAPTGYFDPNETSLHSLIQQTIGLLGAMSIVGFGTNFLRQSIESRERQVADSVLSMKRLGEQQRKILNSMPDAVITTDTAGIVTSANSAAHLLLGVTGEMTGRPLEELARSCIPTFSNYRINTPAFGKMREYEVSDPKKGRRLVECLEQAIGNDTDSSRGILYYLRDITEQRELEKQRELEYQYQQAVERRDSSSFRVEGTGGLIGESLLFRKVIDLVRRVAPSDATVLIHGESGTGKELIARAIHQQSRWSAGPFVPVNCGAIPESLIESDLFGHKKGAFTGAIADHLGYFREAANGTLFLDEIGELPLSVQAKLLRVLQERVVRPVGGGADIAINARIITATNRNLKRESDAGRFREDLYYRINVVNITLPPLRERREDLPLLISHFLEQARRDGHPPAELASDTLRLLISYSYPGNIRELENIIQRATVLGGSLILPEHLPEAVIAGGGVRPARSPEKKGIELPCSLDGILSTVEKEYLLAALEKSGGSRREAARLLGVNLRSLRYRIQKFGLESEAD